MAARFVAALATPEAACGYLAPGTRKELTDSTGSACADALSKEDLPSSPPTVRSVAVAGHSAEAVLVGQVLFLARFDDGWKVTAAGCSRVSRDTSTPYDCLVKGS